MNVKQRLFLFIIIIIIIRFVKRQNVKRLPWRYDVALEKEIQVVQSLILDEANMLQEI